MPKHGRDVNAVEDDMFVTIVDELITPLLTVKRNLLKAGLFRVVAKAATSVYPYQLVVIY